MGNGVTTLSPCCTGTVAGEISRRYDVSLVHDGLGHSFCYIRPDVTGVAVSPSYTPEIPLRSEPIPETTTFRSISGASVSANPSTALSGSASSDSDCMYSSASAFESSGNFASLPLQPVPRGGSTCQSGPIVNEPGHESGPFERRFLSGPIESGLYSGPIEFMKKNKTEKEKPMKKKKVRRKASPEKPKPKKKKNFLTFKALFTNLISNNKPSSKKSVIEPINGSESPDSDRHHEPEIVNENPKPDHKREAKEEEEEKNKCSVLDVQWAQGKAGEDRVHVVVSEENGWVFVGIYDGFSGPDAPDYLLNNLYTAVQKELNGLLCNDEKLRTLGQNGDTQIGKRSDKEDSDSGKENFPVTTNIDAVASGARNQEKSVKWRCEWENNDTKSDNDCDQKGSNSTTTNHGDVLRALVQALRKTEEAYLELADTMVEENPELALMGSCVLVTLMKGEDVYVMNVGDSRAVLARKPNVVVGSRRQKEMERIKEVREMFMNGAITRNSLVPLQLNKEHSTRIEEEVRRIKKEHPEDDGAIENDRVKGYLKVTRAFGAGFLKQPKWNDALLEMFRIDYIGTSPYITCSPSLCHHKLTSRDKFLILSSDGLYEYFSNQEAIFEVESFISAFPEGDPAQHLIQEVLLRAANKYGMDFHELLEIPQGDRRRYHDDISVIVISLEGRIWRSSM
ncbi:PREDICTED: probable protein phosphatase 2C 66 [Brassica oleracea var. oleracea]|uniref:protein-serine/threonine phosphatase n=1 Tax=Brassica oleracea var. oleracea TaxID=109376 RepID=A0A0D3EIC2_BRAOL|nr:PREDICTED: probable protein phosphatase 2C 66 [Brassica oleracea var. oleracea]